MALLQISKGNRAELDNISYAEGRIYVCEDTGEIFVDISATERIKVGGDNGVIINSGTTDLIEGESELEAGTFYAYYTI